MTTAKQDWCYWISETQDPAKHGGYVPSRVDWNVLGHWPMTGRGEGSAPWVWGKTLAEAQEVCRKANADMGLSDRDVDRILCSSMFPQGKGIT